MSGKREGWNVKRMLGNIFKLIYKREQDNENEEKNDRRT